MTQSWQFWALLSAAFAALTAIFAKVGSDFATLIRTGVILVVVVGIVAATGQWQRPTEISGRTWLFLGLSGLATGASWLAYFRALKLGDTARVAPIDKLSIVLVALFGVLFLGEKLNLMNWLGVGLIAAGALLLAVF
ncbi:EamA family transporter [Sinorhizobium medicae]|uniref:EamA family transporter n=1 Tax=Sinorhizobium medicae TaxID=110321 RepID=UPI000C7ADEA0|nr:EamA family transporter [Sinorhizobium medicae]PLU43769.1 transporter [Sinorhizobium medicae]